METMPSSSPFSAPHEPPNYEEYSMEDSLLFSDSLKDLKNLRTQLYSAAEYFEVLYTNDDQKQTVVNTLKDYTIHALVNTVDHIGSFTYKVTDLLDEKVDGVSGTELQVSCIEQRIRTCQEYIDREGLSQQSLTLTTPTYHKRYVLPVNGTARDSEQTVSEYQGCHGYSEDKQNHFINGVKTTIRGSEQSSVRRGRSSSPSPRPSLRPGSFSFTEKTEKHKLSEKRTASPLRSKFPLLRSASPSKPSTPQSSRPPTPTRSRQTTPTRSRPPTPVRSRQTTPTPSRPTTPIPSRPINTRTQHHADSRKPSSIHFHDERDNQKDIKQNSSKSKRLFKALLGRRKMKQDDTLYTYLDEY